MIQKQKDIASYLLLRDGIYYFQMRLKRNDSRRYRLKSGLIRKSLKTSNYREAVHKARIMWFHYMMTDNMKHMNETTKNEATAQHLSDMYSRGKELHQIYSQLDENDLNQIDSFFAHELGTSGYTLEFDQRAFEYYKEKNHTINNAIVLPPQTSDQSTEKLSCYIDKYIDENINVLKNWKPTSHAKFGQDLRFFCFCMKDCKISELSIDRIKTDYINVLLKIPANLGKFKDVHDKAGNLLSMDKILAYAQKNKLKQLSNNSIKHKITTVQAFIKWCEDHEYVRDNIKKAFAFTKKIKSDSNKRHPFTDVDLQKLFNREEFYNGSYHRKYNFRHWGLLIALYSGMRANEICQLKIKNIIFDENTNIACFDISDADVDQSVKNKPSKRVVPIHETLTKLGFMNFCNHQSRTRNKNDLLFEHLTFHKSKNNHTQKLIKWFNEVYIYETGVKKRSDEQILKSFHSFRHTFIDYEKQHRLDREILEEVVGHSSSNTAHDGYQNKFGIDAKKKEIDKIKYDIDIDKFKVWK